MFGLSGLLWTVNLDICLFMGYRWNLIPQLIWTSNIILEFKRSVYLDQFRVLKLNIPEMPYNAYYIDLVQRIKYRPMCYMKVKYYQDANSIGGV